MQPDGFRSGLFGGNRLQLRQTPIV